ncbi:MAG TPA: hypothetical protein VNC84_03460 [Gammaproteobacteria bacterium]|jgi:hypothetical protein|nr:hypothetical protein [Gammaproteobacteria bacterium]
MATYIKQRKYMQRVGPIEKIRTSDRERKQKRLKDNYFTRAIELIRIEIKTFSEMFIIGRDILKNVIFPPDVDEDVQLAMILSNTIGLCIALSFHLLAKDKLYKEQSRHNPLYRNMKTLANLGLMAATIVTFFVPLPAPFKKFLTMLIANIFSLVFGLLAVPYWVFRSYYYTEEEQKADNEYAVLGLEGWSKYAKTALVVGMQLGLIIGACIVFAGSVSMSALLPTMGIAGAIAGVSLFFITIVVVPVINYFFDGALILRKKDSGGKEPDKNRFRNNYPRSGITFGLGIGPIIGYLIGATLLPGINIMALMILSGAICALLGGAILSVCGYRINKYFHSKDGNANNCYNSDNSFDYATRSTSYVMSYGFGFIGCLLGLLLPVPGGLLASVALFTAVGSVAGWFGGLGIITMARRYRKEETTDTADLPWTQRIACGANVGAIVGAAVAVTFCMIVIGPFVLEAATLGAAVGGFLGGIGGGFMGETTRDIAKDMLPTRLTNCYQKLRVTLWGEQPKKDAQNTLKADLPKPLFFVRPDYTPESYHQPSYHRPTHRQSSHCRPTPNETEEPWANKSTPTGTMRARKPW